MYILHMKHRVRFPKIRKKFIDKMLHQVNTLESARHTNKMQAQRAIFTCLPITLFRPLSLAMRFVTVHTNLTSDLFFVCDA